MGLEYRAVAEVDRVIHEPARLMLVAILFPLDSADFLFLLRESGLTKGNLSTHLARLEDAGYVTIEKSFRGKVPRTTASLTEAGRAAFQSYRERLRVVVEGGRTEPAPQG